MNKFILLAIPALITTAAGAKTLSNGMSGFHSVMNGEKISFENNFNRISTQRTYSLKQAYTAMKNEPSDTSKVGVNFIFDQSKYFPQQAILIDNNGNLTRMFMGMPPKNLPNGTYTVAGNFINTPNNEKKGTSWIFFNNVKIAGDTTINLDPSICNKRIEFHPMLPGNKEFTLPLLKYSEKGEFMEVLEKGNVNPYEVNMVIYADDVSLGLYSTTIGTRVKIGSGEVISYDRGSDMHVNELPENISIGCFVDGTGETGHYALTIPVGKVDGNTIFRNDPEKYKKYTTGFVKTPIVISNDSIFFDSKLNFFHKGHRDVTASVRCYAPKTEENIKTFEAYSNRYICDQEFPDGEYSLSFNPDQSVAFTGNKDNFFNMTFYGMTVDGADIDYGMNAHIVPYPHEFEYIKGNKQCGPLKDYGYKFDNNLLYGNSSPIMIFHALIVDKEKSPWGLSSGAWEYEGRLGEVRSIDLLKLKLALTNNGKTEYIRADTIGRWINQWNDTPHTGSLSIKGINDNILIDNSIKGHNSAEMIFPSGKIPLEMPLLRMLQFRNADNMASDRFETPRDGELLLSAGVFKLENDNNRDYFTLTGQPQIKVEYSPYGQENWKQFELTVQPEGSSETGFGYLFRGKTQQVTESSPNKWYDLRIYLSDKNGNVQNQTISPAFRINSLSGIADTINDDSAEVVKQYNLQGIEIEDPEKGTIVIQLLSNGKTRKVVY